MSSLPPSTSPSFPTLLTNLLSHPAPILPPPRIISPKSTPSIAALSLHPTLETALHILNGDLPAAHFLVRHMQAEPAFEGMYLHGILHRVEGDYENAKAWYTTTSPSPIFQSIWPSLDTAHAFITRIATLRKEGRHPKGEGDKDDALALEKESRREIEAVIAWCRDKFGDGEVKDASEVWVQPSKEHREMGEKMVTGGEGWRVF